MNGKKPKGGCERDDLQQHDLLTALADPTVGAEQLMAIAWRVYRDAGCPYGETDRGLVLWLRYISGPSKN